MTDSTETPLKTCSGCKIALYCSPECSKKDWASHKSWCQRKERKPNGLEKDRSSSEWKAEATKRFDTLCTFFEEFLKRREADLEHAVFSAFNSVDVNALISRGTTHLLLCKFEYTGYNQFSLVSTALVTREVAFNKFEPSVNTALKGMYAQPRLDRKVLAGRVELKGMGLDVISSLKSGKGHPSPVCRVSYFARRGMHPESRALFSPFVGEFLTTSLSEPPATSEFGTVEVILRDLIRRERKEPPLSTFHLHVLYMSI